MQSIPVFHSSKVVSKNYSYSPSAGKPALAVESWQALGIPIDILEPTPVTVDELCYAHGRTYVEKVLACRADNGFGNRLPEVAALLPYTTGAFVGAARKALRNCRVAVAPVSGFHHASYDQASGFCTFNGLVVAAQVLKKAGLRDHFVPPKATFEHFLKDAETLIAFEKLQDEIWRELLNRVKNPIRQFQARPIASLKCWAVALA
ncbi:MAG: hypothetical protein H7Z18_06935 [Methylophilaceae bacterium]|nr:hypothetical protein [Methylophilaceae bacterium]